MLSEKYSRKDKNQNIQVFVRLRPLNQRELTTKSMGVVEVVNNREVVVRQSQQTTLTKKFSFDRAFGPYAKQVEVYQSVVSPLIEEVLAGYNCTVFAYGQTGTGKTHTMVGENTTDHGTTWQNDPLAGIIPRALSQLFDELRLSNTEYTVRVSYLELYNEELFDLLATSEDNSKLRIYEDVTRKGSNIVNGLEEITVYNKNEVYKIMEQGQERKKVASTLMNAQSSRSHTVFTIVVHMKENSPEGEELVKIGKLNLVDLAGSENISKAGSDNPAKKERARECVNINQSLLTLGRVITALVERHPHIPYSHHTVFTIVVHMKENSPEGEELVKIGKLNLVDLAGSENISKAGSDNPAKKERARECVNINQSLLTLGRVITALVERHPHIPYRESKLTRILQESLGGRTKTSIIATISPGHKDLEETMSTLDYAHRAKNIQNKPEINQKMTKKAILKEYSEEIDRLKRDLQAARDKNGVYLANETYVEMTLKEEEQRKEIQDLLLQKRAMEEQKERMESVFSELNEKLQQREAELDDTVRSLQSTKKQLNNTSQMLKTTKLHFEEQRHLVEKQRETEARLSSQAKVLLNTAEKATSHLLTLHDNVDRRRSIESRNLELTKSFREQSASKRAEIESLVEMFTQHLSGVLEYLLNGSEFHSANTVHMHTENQSKMENLKGLIETTLTEMKQITEATTQTLRSNTKSKRNDLHTALLQHCDNVQGLINGFVSQIDEAVSRANNIDEEGRKSFGGFIEQWLSSSTARITSLRKLEHTLLQHIQSWQCDARDANKRSRNERKCRFEQRQERILACIEEIKAEKQQMEAAIAQQLSDIDTDREEHETRLQLWVERERKVFEARIQEHVDEQRRFMDEKLAKRLRDVEEQKVLLEERISKHLQWQQEQLSNYNEDEQIEDTTSQQCDEAVQQCLERIEECDVAFGLESNAISKDITEFSQNIKQTMNEINTNIIASVQQVKHELESSATQLLAQDKSDTASFADSTDVILSGIVRDTEQIVHDFIDRVEKNNTTITSELNTISNQRITDQITSERNHLTAQSTQLKESQGVVLSFKQNLSREVKNQGDLEGRYLGQEYGVYKPSGATPVRQEFSYPRTLAATSPHQRILARFRACSIDEDDCVLVENSLESNPHPASDSESSTVSDDSAVVFVAPSPPADGVGVNALMKSTSESDVYRITKEKQGKENTTEKQMSASSRKPSRLPALSSLKKPLIERNAES